MKKKYVHYGCCLTAPIEWENYDTSPTLKIQKIPIIGRIFKKQLNIIFPNNVKIGDIIKGLPTEENSCDGIYCSHVLEHLALEDFRIALQNTYKILKPNGIFRCVVPDLEVAVRKYIKNIDLNEKQASIDFLKETLLGIEKRPRSIIGLMKSYFGNTHHMWMWDSLSLINEMGKVGFKQIRRAEFNDSKEEMFKLVESEDRFIDAVVLECRK